MSSVLIVDDSRTMRKMLAGALTEVGIDVAGNAGNGIEALELLKTVKPDLITLDITMPVLDGLGALKLIKEIDAAAKIIMVTAAGQQNKMIDAIKLGAAEFVTKPFEPDEITKMVGKLAES